MLHIGAVAIEQGAALAPMAGVADHAFRRVCADMGASYCVSPLLSAKAMTLGDRKTQALMAVDDNVRPYAIQLFGGDPAIMAQAAAIAQEQKPDVIDINMGCPAPKVASSGGGVTLMGDPARAEAIVKAVRHATTLPVTVKFRKGLTADSVNAVEFARRMEAAGADALCIHGRTRDQMYAPPVDLAIIADVKRAVAVPVIGNGGVKSADDAQAMLDRTGCDLVMVGQGVLGNPFVFRDIAAQLRGEPIPAPPTLDERLACLRRHIELLCALESEHGGMRMARKHVAWYLKGMRGAASLRSRAGTLSTLAAFYALLDEVRNSC